MKKFFIHSFAFIFALTCLVSYEHVFAHEMYVLESEVAHRAIATDSPNPLMVIFEQTEEFIVWSVLIFSAFLLSLFVSLNKRLREKLVPVWEKTKHYGPNFVRAALGFCVFISAVMGSLFGPEFPLTEVFGPLALGVKILMLMVGPLLVIGFYPRVTSFIVILLYGWGLVYAGVYALAYASFLGAALFILLRESSHYRKNAFQVLRIFYGGALISAALYAKFIHSNLALETINAFQLTEYLPFTPHFLLLGAFLVEVVVGLCIMFGIQLRLVTFIFTGILIQSLLFFNEAVWPHLILFGLNFAIFAHGYDKHTLLAKFTKEGAEPAL